jgi:hypothetical protein
MSGARVEYFAVPFIGMHHDECRVLGNRFEEMLDKIAEAEPAVVP